MPWYWGCDLTGTKWYCGLMLNLREFGVGFRLDKYQKGCGYFEVMILFFRAYVGRW